VSTPNKPDTPGKGLARALELDLDLEEVGAVARREDGDGTDGADGERPTVAPPFDVTAFAREADDRPSQHGRPPPLPTAAEASPSITPMRGPSQTLTDEVELENARKRSVNTHPPSMPASRAETAPPPALTPMSIPATSQVDTRKTESSAKHPAEREPPTRVTRASGNLLMLADARLHSVVPPAHNPGNAWSSIDRGWSAEDEEVPTNEADTVIPEASASSRELGDPADTPLPPASGQATSEPPTSKRSPTLRPGAHTAPTPPAHKPFVSKRATRVWTSETASIVPAALSPSSPPSSSPGGREAREEREVHAASSVSPPGERSPHVGSTLEERVEHALSAAPESFSDEEAALQADRQRATPYPGGRATRDLEAPRITPLAVPRLGLEDDLTLVKPSGSRSSVPPTRKAETEPTQEMRERFSLGDYTGALAIAESILEEASDTPAAGEAREYAESCRSVLQQMYTARIGPLDRVPVVMVPRDQLRWLSIDHRAGFVLSHVDGISSLEMILDVSGMPVLDTLRILCELNQQRIISFR
jgi:hypothetical protein